jgi:hydroxymethylpyrimidine pyrophosphatase-like HAD family hydrolase
MPEIDLVVTDLDGTLWSAPTSFSENPPIHARTRAALAELDRRRVAVLVATGRRRATARVALAHNDLSLDAVLLDGALGATADEVLFQACPFGDEAVRSLIDAFAAVDHEPVLETDEPDVEVIRGANPSCSLAALSEVSTVTVDLDEPLPHAVFSAFAVVELDVVEAVTDALAASSAGIATVYPFRNRPLAALKVRPSTCSKWNAVVTYCELVGADPSRVLAIGDDNNDVELLHNARVALAPLTASPAAAAEAHHLVGPAAEGGWAQLLDHL